MSARKSATSRRRADTCSSRITSVGTRMSSRSADTSPGSGRRALFLHGAGALGVLDERRPDCGDANTPTSVPSSHGLCTRRRVNSR